MHAKHLSLLLAIILCSTFVAFDQAAKAADSPYCTRIEDVIYGRKYGTALTLDVLVPKEKTNGIGIIRVVSGAWFSAHEAIDPDYANALLRRGYTVFAVVHGSQPQYTIPETIEDISRSVRFIRHSASRWSIDPDRLGIIGGSAAGHLSLMMAMAGKSGPANAKDPVDRESSHVQAVACFFPPTDFLNFGEPGRTVFNALDAELTGLKAPFDFRQLDSQTHRLLLITNAERQLEIAREISPITWVSSNSPPTLLIHGDLDKVVPLQQSRVLEQKLRDANVPVKLVVKPGAGHGWPNVRNDVAIAADWFDQHLLRK